MQWLAQYSPDQHVNFLRGYLGRMLFSGEDADKKVKVLSGGEKVRCLFAKMMIAEANVMIFDEPTNHLDLESIAALNNGLIRYPETVLFTSHDHQFVQTVADRIIEISGNKYVDRKGSYDEFLSVFDEEQLRKY
jgi:ATPase subunit of ABC transporter with duplicated ATPase domains